MRAEVEERRDWKDSDNVYGGLFQTRWVSAGKFPFEYDVTSPYGFYSTMATPPDDPKYGERSLWRNFIQFFPRPNSSKVLRK